jgi:SAM-dependent methyltransferase
VGVPPWAWLLPLALLALVYPMQTWRDAPLFPTPVAALGGIGRLAPLASGACVLDAGCGLGHGLSELHREYPQVELHGLEWSWPLRWACARRAPYAHVRRADIWRADWSRYDMVYLFQRPDTMARAGAKAERELRPGAWLVSLDFAVPGWVPTHTLEGGAHRAWLYQAPFRRA